MAFIFVFKLPFPHSRLLKSIFPADTEFEKIQNKTFYMKNVYITIFNFFKFIYPYKILS